MQKMSLLLYIKKPKAYKQGEAPIYLRITIGGKRGEISTGQSCLPVKWNQAAGKIRGNTADVNTANEELEQLRKRVQEIYTAAAEANHAITPGEIVKKLTQPHDRPRMLVEIIRHHNDEIKSLLGIEYAPSTLVKYVTFLHSVEAFLEHKYQCKDIDIRTLDYSFITDFEFYLKTEQHLQHNTCMGFIKKLKKIIRQCVGKNWLDKDPFMLYKMKIKETHRSHLNDAELQMIAEKQFDIDRLDQVKDLFLFSCYTGLSYADVVKLTPSEIEIGIDGEKWIYTTREKTDTPSRIPLLPLALDILEKYKHKSRTRVSNKLLPGISNQRLNSYLKEIADCCGIQKTLTFHCARHTFATTVTLSNGVPIETVSKMLGHKSLRTTQLYAKIVDRKVADDMLPLKNKFKQQTTEEGQRKTANINTKNISSR